MEALGHGRIRWIRVRIAILVFAMLIGAAYVARGAWDLGVNRKDELNRLAEEQYTRRITLPARRGMVTDRHGEELAVEVEVDSVYADARKIKSPNAAAALLATILEVKEAVLLKRFISKRHFVWISRRITPAAANKVRELDIEGVSMLKESKRFYPSRSLAAHMIGFAGIDSVGLEGIELKFDEQLRGHKNAVQGLRDARGRVVFADSVFGPKGVVGNTVELTIDRTLQYIAEQELAATIRTFNAKSGHIIIMEPSTGEILALANSPGYNPNALGDSAPADRRNRAVLDVIEPGSTFKIFTLSAALNAGVIRPDDLIFCERGRMEIGDRKKVAIRDDHADGWLNPTQCLKRSSNICFAKIAFKLGKKRLYHYLRRFGFGEQTHVDLPFEAKGILHHYKKWYDIDAATTSFGQGVGTTGLQLATALSSLANGGVLMRPLLVKRIVGPDKETIRAFAPESRRRVVSRYTARLVGDIMTSVTEEGGTGIEGSIDGFLVAGKTGTAQKSVGSKGYTEEKYISSFIGFVPADRPRLAITVVIDEPLINHYGGTVAAPALRRVADQALRYLGISPRASESKKKNVSKKRKRKKRAPIEADQGKDDEVFTAQEIKDLGPNQVVVPDLSGLTMTEAMKALSASEIRPLFFGTGFAVEQVPPAHDPVDRGGFVQVNFEPLEQRNTAPDPKEDTEEETLGNRS
ncbi:MAG: transpeptidase family protein [Deltaproteobacteria bacterium]|nr:transpeptidase family protein [Deltaproteobacteria bacterium]